MPLRGTLSHENGEPIRARRLFSHQALCRCAAPSEMKIAPDSASLHSPLRYFRSGICSIDGLDARSLEIESALSKRDRLSQNDGF
jgi:hypothetical protein